MSQVGDRLLVCVMEARWEWRQGRGGLAEAQYVVLVMMVVVVMVVVVEVLVVQHDPVRPWDGPVQAGWWRDQCGSPEYVTTCFLYLPSLPSPCPALPCPVLPCPALPYPALPCPTLPCPARTPSSAIFMRTTPLLLLLHLFCLTSFFLF
ncbi:hypothetical protein E2C01_084638 [Portunus trituberculatus]|uniref:Uncharacterized protein n=1 Tax=Portunus trituberculatus TaxID=210409 RepID=A0A5B7JB95_PORTR|nr:hypothetical protein [Portunus trituberculatus]